MSAARPRVADAQPVAVAPALFATLYWWRLRHIAQAAYRLVMRRWQVVVLLLLLSPRDMPILEQLRILGHPILVLTSPGAPRTVLAIWLILLLMAQAWAHVQGEVLAGGPAWAFAQAQPLPPGLARRVDLAVLAVGDVPLFLPFLAALCVLPAAGLAQRVLQGAAIVVAAAQLPLVQWLAPRRPRIAAALVGAQLGGLACLALGLSAAPFVLGALAADALALRRADELPRPPRGARASRVRATRLHLPAAAPVWLRLAAVDLRSLFQPRRLLDRLALLASILLPWVLREYLVLYDVRAPVVTVVVVLTLVPLVMKVSTLAFELRRLHEPMRLLHASLGIRPRLLRAVDAGVLLAIWLPAATPLAAATWASRPGAPALAVLPLGALALLACTALNQRGDRGVLLPKVLACAAAAGASLAVMRV